MISLVYMLFFKRHVLWPNRSFHFYAHQAHGKSDAETVPSTGVSCMSNSQIGPTNSLNIYFAVKVGSADEALLGYPKDCDLMSSPWALYLLFFTGVRSGSRSLTFRTRQLSEEARTTGSPMGRGSASCKNDISISVVFNDPVAILGEHTWASSRDSHEFLAR